MRCPVCFLQSEMLTLEQAGLLAQVSVQRIYEWLAEGKTHGLETHDGQKRICSRSLFKM